MAPQQRGDAATLVPMATELGQEEQKALQGHQSKGEWKGDSQSLGTFLPFSLKDGPSISPICWGSQAFGERDKQIWRNRWMTRPTAKSPTGHHFSPGWVTGQAPPRTSVRRGVPPAPGTCSGRGGGEGEPQECQQTLGGSQVESEGAGGRDQPAQLSAVEILPLRAGFTTVPLPLTLGYARSSHRHHLFHSEVWDYSDSIFSHCAQCIHNTQALSHKAGHDLLKPL